MQPIELVVFVVIARSEATIASLRSQLYTAMTVSNQPFAAAAIQAANFPPIARD
jgi:hypothetical protein